MMYVMAPVKHEERVELRVPTDDLETWRRQADYERMSLSAWIRHVCNHAVAHPPEALTDEDWARIAAAAAKIAAKKSGRTTTRRSSKKVGK